ncbi:MAG: ribosome maturation factor RimM [Syntrophales bacterium]|nr:ribosome maturation factor RimM [Syntrophales bacterium]
MNELFEIGRIVKTHGLNGRVKLNSYLVDPGRTLQRAEEVFLRRGSTEKGPVKVVAWDIKGRNIFLVIEGIEDVGAAEAVVGFDVLISADHLDALPEEEFYWRDLIGMTVVTEDGETLGTLTSIFTAGGADVYVCTGQKGEILLPAIGNVILKIDKAKMMMTVHILEGMDKV